MSRVITCVRGSFVTEDGQPVDGCVEFLPRVMWFWESGKAWAALAPHVVLKHGKFNVYVTGSPFQRSNYTVITPAGEFELTIPNSDKPLYLKELISKSRIT